jgi:hypothetical protein
MQVLNVLGFTARDIDLVTSLAQVAIAGLDVASL